MIDDTERALQAAVRADFGSQEPMLVYADWLEEHGRAEAKLLRLFVEHGEEPGDKASTQLPELRRTADPLWLVAIGDTQRRLTRLVDEFDELLVDEFEHHAELNDYLQLGLRTTDSCLGLYERDGLLDLEVWYDFHEEVPDELGLMSFLAQEEIAPAVGWMFLWMSTAGNGTAAINFTELISGHGDFKNLRRFATNFHNEDGECIATGRDGFLEEGVLSSLLAKTPAIEEMVLPSAPSSEFFEVGERPLKRLHLKAGFDAQKFLHHFSRSSCFPELQELIYEDCYMDYMDEWREHITPFEEILEFFQSPALQPVQTLELRNVLLTEEQTSELLAIRSDGVTIRAIESDGG